MSAAPTTSLADENAELRRRVEAADAIIDRLIAESSARERLARGLAAELPRATSRRQLLRGLVADTIGRLRVPLRGHRP